MNETPEHAGGSMFSLIRASGIEGRIFRTMMFATGLAVIASLPFARWRITTGLLVGGLLSLLNHYWLTSSTAAAFSVVLQGTDRTGVNPTETNQKAARPKIKLAQYVLRYLVVAAVVFIAYKLDIVSLTATIIGLCSFVVALFAEALREFYFVIIHREGIS
jgi:ATP synthase I subunit